MSCGVGRRCGSDPELLWLWCRLAAVALIGPLTWDPPYAAGVALKSKNKQTKKNNHYLGGLYLKASFNLKFILSIPELSSHLGICKFTLLSSCVWV